MPSPIPEKEEIMDFPNALRHVINGKQITKLEWGDPTIYVVLKDGFLTIKRHDGYHRLVLNDGDLFGEDWVVVSDHGLLS